MEESPYRSPQVDVFENKVPGGPPNREKARKVAEYQRWVIYALLANILLYIVALPNARNDLLTSFIIIAFFLLIGFFAVFAVYMLAKEVSNPGVAVICAILMFMPCVSLITLLVINQKATSFLQSQGIHVGLLGTDPKKI